MDTCTILMKTSCYCIVLVLLCCQYGVSYRVYILPELGAFVSVSSLEMTASLGQATLLIPPLSTTLYTTLIFTPGNYSLPENSGAFSAATINTFTMIGDKTQL